MAQKTEILIKNKSHVIENEDINTLSFVMDDEGDVLFKSTPREYTSITAGRGRFEAECINVIKIAKTVAVEF